MGGSGTCTRRHAHHAHAHAHAYACQHRGSRLNSSTPVSAQAEIYPRAPRAKGFVGLALLARARTCKCSRARTREACGGGEGMGRAGMRGVDVYVAAMHAAVVSGCASQLGLRQSKSCRWSLREIATADCHHVHTCVHYTRTQHARALSTSYST